jgi:hypothetical protein
VSVGGMLLVPRGTVLFAASGAPGGVTPMLPAHAACQWPLCFVLLRKSVRAVLGAVHHSHWVQARHASERLIQTGCSATQAETFAEGLPSVGGVDAARATRGCVPEHESVRLSGVQASGVDSTVLVVGSSQDGARQSQCVTAMCRTYWCTGRLCSTHTECATVVAANSKEREVRHISCGCPRQQ